MNPTGIDYMKSLLAHKLKEIGEQATWRCFWPWVESEPEAPACILQDIPQEE